MDKNLTLVVVGSSQLPVSPVELERDEKDFIDFVKAQNLPIVPLVVAYPCKMELFSNLQNGDRSSEKTFTMHVKVGNDDRPASTEDIEDVRQKIERVIEENGLPIAAFVSHHVTSIEMFPQMTLRCMHA